ncbi:hypothetical protein [Brachybacterium phenoliresistens]|uniref:hypothetical protein n=1 Tax=Brachybacterium phenoliresistens TaxID=396014 RepID=UPI0031CFD4CC
MRSATVALAVVGLVWLAACSAAEEGDQATWSLAPGQEVTAETTVLKLEATRTSCANGRTGELLEPVITVSESRVIVRIDAVPLKPGGYDCPGNDRVPVTVRLEEPVGDRELVDGGCLREDAREIGDCEDPVRWSGA